MAKKITFDTQARDALKRGADALANAVKVTLGPKGRNEIIEIKNTNSGEIKKLKFKKALSLLESGDWIINSH